MFPIVLTSAHYGSCCLSWHSLHSCQPCHGSQCPYHLNKKNKKINSNILFDALIVLLGDPWLPPWCPPLPFPTILGILLGAHHHPFILPIAHCLLHVFLGCHFFFL